MSIPGFNCGGGHDVQTGGDTGRPEAKPGGRLRLGDLETQGSIWDPEEKEAAVLNLVDEYMGEPNSCSSVPSPLQTSADLHSQLYRYQLSAAIIYEATKLKAILNINTNLNHPPLASDIINFYETREVHS